MQLVNIENGFSLIENDKVVFSHTIDNPAIFIGKGKEKTNPSAETLSNQL